MLDWSLERICCGVLVDYKCMEFVAVGWCTGDYLTLDQTIKNLTCGDSENPNVAIRLEVTGLKKIGFVFLLNLLWGGERG